MGKHCYILLADIQLEQAKTITGPVRPKNIQDRSILISFIGSAIVFSDIRI